MNESNAATSNELTRSDSASGHSPKPAILFEEVSKTFREAGKPHAVLQNVNLRIEPGQVVAILGRSGSGKSTLLNLMAGIDAPSSGLVQVAGIPIHELDERQRTLFRRHNVGFVYQFFNLIPTLTTLENVRLPLELRGLPEADAVARRWLGEVGLLDRADSDPDRLSGGEQQRVAVARALAGDPALVLADEPTGNLDVEIGDQVLALLCERSRSRKRTLVMVTHSRRVAALADRVLRVEERGVVEEAVEL
jgi:putative ABC transport system ATP-binding protein